MQQKIARTGVGLHIVPISQIFTLLPSQNNQLDNIALISYYFEHCDLLSGKQSFPQTTGSAPDSVLITTLSAAFMCCYPQTFQEDFLQKISLEFCSE